mgnify:CR=1 FL=1
MAARGGLTGQTACARTPSWVSPLGSGSPFRPGPGARGSEGCSQRSAALGIRLPGGVTRATESSPRFLPLRLSEDGAVTDPEDGIRVGLGRSAQSCRASVEGQPAGRRGRASDTFSVDRAAEAVGPTISSGLKERPRLSSHKFQSHGNAQAHRRGYSNMRLRTWLGFWVVMRKRVWLGTTRCDADGVRTQLVLRQDGTVCQTAGAVVCDSRPGTVHPCWASKRNLS